MSINGPVTVSRRQSGATNGLCISNLQAHPTAFPTPPTSKPESEKTESWGATENVHEQVLALISDL